MFSHQLLRRGPSTLNKKTNKQKKKTSSSKSTIGRPKLTDYKTENTEENLNCTVTGSRRTKQIQTYIR